MKITRALYLILLQGCHILDLSRMTAIMISYLTELLIYVRIMKTIIAGFNKRGVIHMKRIIFALLTGVLSLCLTSCRVNWFDEHYNVPWWVITVPVVIFILIVCTAEGKHIASKKYTCPNCNKQFYPKWWKAAVSIHDHGNNYRVFKCPHCGKKGFCPVSRETDE